jgi:dipeptidyl aminopeptidase/acylaminoacyl peptidase
MRPYLIPFTHTNDRGETMPCRLFTPAPLKPGRKIPLAIFLHGAGGNGADSRRVPPCAAARLDDGYGSLWAMCLKLEQPGKEQVS